MICLMMGICMPLLYFVAAWGLFVNYVVDRLALAYYYKLPSKFNEKLTKTAIHTLNFLPLFTLPFIFWLYTNQQMFSNKIDPIQSMGEIELSNHFLYDILDWSKLNPSMKSLMISFLFLILFSVANLLFKKISSLFEEK